MSRSLFCRWATMVAIVMVLSPARFLDASIDRGVIQGTVTDQGGAVVPGAKVAVRNVDTNVELNLVTNASGFYLASELVPGKYTVHVDAQGFSALEVTNIPVTAGQTTVQDLSLKVGAVSQRIGVTAAPP